MNTRLKTYAPLLLPLALGGLTDGAMPKVAAPCLPRAGASAASVGK